MPPDFLRRCQGLAGDLLAPAAKNGERHAVRLTVFLQNAVPFRLRERMEFLHEQPRHRLQPRLSLLHDKPFTRATGPNGKEKRRTEYDDVQEEPPENTGIEWNAR